MTAASTPPSARRRIETLDELPPPVARDVLELIERAAVSDGQPAVSEQGRLNLRGGPRPGIRHLLVTDDGELVGYGQLEETDPVEAPAAEFVVAPGHRGRGHGRALGQALLEASGKRLRVWAHGGHPGARHLAVQLGLSLFRELRQMRRPLPGEPLPEPRLPRGITVRAFRPGEDDAAWLAVNAVAFSHHPEQGSLTQRDLDDRKAEPWFDPAGFFLAVREDDGAIAGFHWTKVHAAERLGEVYVVGVHPDAQGTGLGKALTAIGLRHLADDRGLPTAMLYVDADNAPAVSVYERLGFTTYETDLMYRTEV
ncbi:MULTISPECIES: mycothiol synthase [Streptomycetaceae]|uniref:Mycothiol acetyltransferase n=1 Tax=Streptantibioticus cattleyicolor (strain ATCC 35852 / DSM 46488 / JCM 4925 / NBRC 14057 / NRRL 8057) TaxID=1003195 RepID=F8K146_STREN|nr:MULTISPECIES: mycothiol synthase [Streptomycetaceae]AEW94920.1 mycothiol biosynthesis acetyltransferase [Streptantibioticus cattleyicolor NRRL 8057 = DSM 46488]MYS59526.1 mycothiol synthase [Streptomyces sp. SID5468]CCB75270.1 putative N-cysteinyl-1-D-myo-inosityl-2-amino-2-deoxy-alpha-D-glucopyranoside acetyltransferase [Streptantibioticus cattleyicolor NRRL 8057 = DSM 46488]